VIPSLACVHFEAVALNPQHAVKGAHIASETGHPEATKTSQNHKTSKLKANNETKTLS